jgi:KDO2-lipid IV(A) lauroyltransferase
LGIPATIVMPHDASPAKLAATRGYGAKVVGYDRYKDDALAIAKGLAAEHGMRFIPPFDHPDVLSGQGTAALELFQEVGELDALTAPGPLVVFAPHFVGLDAGGLAVGWCVPRNVAFIFVKQSNPKVEAWVRHGRERSGNARPYFRHEGVRQILAGLKKGEPLHLSPDMDFGRGESIFVPFMGVEKAATVPSLSRFSRVGGARVVPVVTRMTPQGYDIEVHAPLLDFPTADLAQDTVRMNALLADWVRTMPEQYYWVHKRFKTRPEGEPGVY